MHTRGVALLVLGLALFAGMAINLARPAQTAAATSNTINFQARLEGITGAIAPDGYYNVEFKLYSASSGGSPEWTEDWTYNNGSSSCTTPQFFATGDCRIQVINGYLTANLGSLTAFSGINWDQQQWLTMNIGGTSNSSITWDGEMSPRLQLTALPYAFRAGQLAQYNATTNFTSVLQLLQPTGGNQTFDIPDQGASGTYNILAGNAAILNQTALQTASNFDISGSGQAATSFIAPTYTGTGAVSVTAASGNNGLTLQATGTATASLDGGTVTVGNGNATTISIGTNNAAHIIGIGNTGATGTQAITIGGNGNTANTLTLDAGTGSTAIQIGNSNSSHGIQIGAGGTSSSVETIAIGSNSSTSSTTIEGGTSATAASIILNPAGGGISNSNQGVLVQPDANTTEAFQVQNTSNASVLNVDTVNMTVTTRPLTDTATIGSNLAPATMTSSTWSGTGWTVSNTAHTATHTSGVTALSPTTTLAINPSTWYEVEYTLNPNSTSATPGVSTLGVSLGSTSVASYTFDANNNGSNPNYSSIVTVSVLVKTTNTANLAFTPSTGFTGIISGVSVFQVTQNTDPSLVVDNAAGTAASLQVLASNGPTNLFIGNSAGESNSGDNGNTAIGASALQNTTTGTDNTAIGINALQTNTTGINNTAIGPSALQANTSGASNTAIGYQALTANTTGGFSIGIGYQALTANTTGQENAAVGDSALSANTTGNFNAAFGVQALQTVTTGNFDTGVGLVADVLQGSVTGSTALGAGAAVGSNDTVVLGYSNAFSPSVNVGIDTSYAPNALTVAPNTYGVNGTSCTSVTMTQSGTNITASSSCFTPGMTGGTLYTTSSTGTPVVETVTYSSPTALTAASNTVTAGTTFNIVWGGFNVTQSDTVLLQPTSDSTTAFQIQNAAKTNTLFTADTTDSTIALASISASQPLLTVTNNTASTNNIITVSGNGLTSGNALSLTATGNNLTTGALLSVVANAESSPTGIVQIQANDLGTGAALNITSSSTIISTGALLAVTASLDTAASSGLVQIQGNALTSGTALAISTNALTSGAALSISKTGNTVGTGQLLSIQDTTDNGSAGTITTNNGLAVIKASALTTGVALDITSAGGSGLTTGALLNVQGNSEAGPTNGLVVIQGQSLTTGIGVNIMNGIPGTNANSLTTGTLLQLTGSTAETTGSTLNITSGRTVLTPTLSVASASGAVWNGLQVAATTATVTGTTAISSATPFSEVSIAQPTITDSSAVTITNAATLFIAGAPTTGGSLAITNQFGIWNNGLTKTGLSGTATDIGVCSLGLASGATPVSGTAYTLADCSTNPIADYAEMYPAASDVAVGDVVSQGPNQVDTYNSDSQGAVDWTSVKGSISQVVKTTVPYDPLMLGIISDNDSNFSSTGYNIKQSDNPEAVALNGRVPVNVTTENGPIEPGDYLTASATMPGYAMKATQAGYVIGQALASYTSSTPGQVMVFVKNVYYPGPSPSSYLQNGDSAGLADLSVSGIASLANLNVTGNTALTNLAVTGNTALSGLNVSGPTILNDLTVTGSAAVQGDLTIVGNTTIGGSLTVTGPTSVTDLTISGHIITAGGQPTPQAQTAVGQQGTVSITGNDTTGTITITTGNNPMAGALTDVLFSKAYGAAPHIVLSPSNNNAAALRYFKGNTTTNDFMFNSLDTPAPNTTYQYDYFIAQ